MSNSGPETVGELHVSGERPMQALGRLGYAVGLIDQRLAALSPTVAPPGVDRYIGPAFLVHCQDWPALIADDGCLPMLEYIALHGDRCGVVLRVYGTRADVAASTAGRSEALFKEVLPNAQGGGKVIQVVAPLSRGALRPGEGLTAPTNADEVALYSETLSAEVWAALVLSDAEGLVRVFDALRQHMDDAGSLTECRLLSDALRRAADVLVPGSGGMIPSIPCPLCLGSPMFRPDEIEGHLSATHAALINGVRP